MLGLGALGAGVTLGVGDDAAGFAVGSGAASASGSEVGVGTGDVVTGTAIAAVGSVGASVADCTGVLGVGNVSTMEVEGTVAVGCSAQPAATMNDRSTMTQPLML